MKFANVSVNATIYYTVTNYTYTALKMVIETETLVNSVKRIFFLPLIYMYIYIYIYILYIIVLY